MRITTGIAALWCLASSEAYAHAFLDHAEPRVGSTVQTAPREVSLSFTQDLEPAFSGAEVRDGSGKRVYQGRAQVSGTVMRVGVKALPPGSIRSIGALCPWIRIPPKALSVSRSESEWIPKRED
jgi:copper resistance protein C